jgi:hypothetical protein
VRNVSRAAARHDAKDLDRSIVGNDPPAQAIGNSNMTLVDYFRVQAVSRRARGNRSRVPPQLATPKADVASQRCECVPRRCRRSADTAPILDGRITMSLWGGRQPQGCKAELKVGTCYQRERCSLWQACAQAEVESGAAHFY